MLEEKSRGIYWLVVKQLKAYELYDFIFRYWNQVVVLCHVNGGLLTLEYEKKLLDITASNWLYQVML
jgi:hypothetical protein